MSTQSLELLEHADVEKLPAWAVTEQRPFPGLRPFAFEDRKFFFGRDDQVFAIYRLLDLSRFIAVVGTSGGGKSSLVRAGLRPLLDRETRGRGGHSWKWVEMRPGDAPMANLAAALCGPSAASRDETERAICEARRERVRNTLVRSSFGLLDALRQVGLAGDQSVVLVVDQFEELFRYSETAFAAGRDLLQEMERRDESSHFVQLLLEASRDPQIRVHVVITMRSDFIGDCARFHGLPEAVSASQFLVPALTREQRQDIIRKPIRAAGATIDAELVERLINDSTDESDLPVLQHCLMRLWEQAGKPGRVDTGGESGAPNRHLRLDDYDTVGGIERALSRHAEEILAELHGRELAVEQAFRALSELDKNRRAIRRALTFDRLHGETGCAEDDLRRVVDRFRSDDCSFLVPPHAVVGKLEPSTRVDVGHEALLRRWERISREPKADVDATDEERRGGWLWQEESDGRTYRALLGLTESAGAKATATLPIELYDQYRHWWTSRTRTADWAERYGGGLDKVEKLFEDSRAALQDDRRRRKSAKNARVVRYVLLIVLAGLIAASWLAWFLNEQLNVAQQTLAKATIERETAQRAFLAANEQREKAVAERAAANEQREKAEADRAAANEQREKAEADRAAANEQRVKAEIDRNDALRQGEAAMADRIRADLENAAAQAAREEASRKLAKALMLQSQNIAAQSRRETLRGYTRFGVLLAQEAFEPLRRSQMPEADWPQDAEMALQAAVSAVPPSRLIATLPSGRVVIGPGAKYIAATDPSRRAVRILDGNGNQVGEIRHGESVQSIVFSADGEQLVTTSWDQTAQIWRAGGQPVRISTQSDANYAAFNPAGDRVVVATDENARIYNTAGRLLTTLRHEGYVHYAEFSPDGRRILTSDYRQFSVWTGEGKLVFKGDGGTKRAVFNPNGSITTLGDRGDRAARVWTAAGAQAHILTGHTDTITGAAANSDGSRLVTVSDDQTAQVWDTASKELVATLRHEGRVQSVAFSRDGSKVLTTGSDGFVRLWSSIGNSIMSLQLKAPVTAAFDGGEKGLLTFTGNELRRWDIEQHRIKPLIHQHPVTIARFDREAARAVTVAGREARVWDMASGTSKLLSAHAVDDAHFAGDGSRLVTQSSFDGVQLWNVDGTRIARLTDNDDVYRVTPDRAAKRYLIHSRPRLAEVVDDAGKLLKRIADARLARFGANGRWVLVVAGNGDIFLHDLTGGEVRTIRQLVRYPNQPGDKQQQSDPDSSQAPAPGTSEEISSVDISDDGSAILVGYRRGRVELLRADGTHVVTLDLLADNEGGPLPPFVSVFFATGSEKILTFAGKDAALWDADGRKLAAFQHDASVQSFSVRVSRGRIATSFSDGSVGTVRMWGLDGRRLHEINLEGRVSGMSVSPDATRVLAAGIDGVARIFHLHSTEEAQKLAGEAPFAPLTDDERKRFQVYEPSPAATAPQR